jgi:transitional endoplasmic reticulum ATPase
MAEQKHTQDTEAELIKYIDANNTPPKLRLDDIQGHGDAMDGIKEAFIPSMVSPHSEVRSPSILIYGPVGAGKARIGRAIAGELSTYDFDYLQLSCINSHRNKARPYTNLEAETVAKLIDMTREAAPATLIIEDFERSHVRVQGGPIHSAIEEIREAGERVAIICILDVDNPHSNHRQMEDAYDFADFQIPVSFPDGERRKNVLGEKLTQLTSDTKITVEDDSHLSVLGMKDFKMKHIEAAGRRAILLAQNQSTDSPTVTTDHINEGIEQIKTRVSGANSRYDESVNSDFSPNVPDVSFDDIGGLDHIVQRIKELVTYPQRYADLYADSNLKPTSGVLLHGPPGTGKTMLAKALANETERNFFAVEAAEIKGMWYGQSEARLRRLFAEARDAAPSIIFFDEIDALAGRRRELSHSTTQSIVNTLLTELDGIEVNNELLVVAATNQPDRIDPAVKRPGRIGEAIEVPPPDRDGLQKIFQIQSSDLPLHEDVTPAWFTTTIPDGLTGANVAAIVERAMHFAIRRSEADQQSPTICRSQLDSAVEAELGKIQSDRLGYQ